MAYRAAPEPHKRLAGDGQDFGEEAAEHAEAYVVAEVAGAADHAGGEGAAGGVGVRVHASAAQDIRNTCTCLVEGGDVVARQIGNHPKATTNGHTEHPSLCRCCGGLVFHARTIGSLETLLSMPIDLLSQPFVQN
jgi:hypothetical protein